MTILNLMLGKGRGGLEQAALDYAEALAFAKIPALTVISPGAWVEAPLVAAGITHESLANYGQWDFYAAAKLRRLAKRKKVRAIICHGNRAIALALRAVQGTIPVIAVAHNYSVRRFVKADACFSITRHLAEHLTSTGARNITLMPNMVRPLPAGTPPAFRSPPVIGAMGRFVAKKGFKTYIEALSVLRSRGVAFQAVLGGDGDEASAIDALIERYDLGQHVTRTGWVADKRAFFDGIDIFVLPSLHEPFGIVLIEAMNHGVATISADAEGPSEILHHGKDGLLVPRKDPEAMADALAELIANPAYAAELAMAGQKLVTQEYSLAAMAGRLQTALAPYIN